MAELSGQTALVTGASSGIGAAIARELAQRGAGVILAARRRDRLEALADELKDQVPVHVEAIDLGNPGSPAVLVERLGEAGLQVDILINNAGFGTHHDFAGSEWERQRGMVQVNLVSLTELTHRLLPAMVERGRGHVMNIASIAAFLPVPEFAVYGATKAFVRNFTEALDWELKGTGVRAMAVSPGGTRTEFMEVAGNKLTRIGLMASMSAQQCARIAVHKMLGGRRGLVTGLINAIGMWLLRFAPRSLMPFFGKHVMGLAMGPLH